MEGRKYGLFLILVTQRPARVNSNLLSQCDNLCLMKMSNPADVRLVQDRFGFVPSGWAERALSFKQGEVQLSGQFVERPVVAKVAPRRTVEGGRSLRDAVWLTDPS
jgi:DNA helicase HerA-like ATPase